ncbi:hypothetical protein LCGC14_2569030, partial [marine sediment metagenome]
HVSMVVKVRDLLSDQEAALEEQGMATEAGNPVGFGEAVVKEGEIAGQIDDLVTASQYSGTEVSGMFSIRKMVLSRSPSDYAAILKRVQAASGLGKGVSVQQKAEITRLSKENAVLVKENDRLTEEDQAARDKQEEADAQEIFDANKPKKGKSKEHGKRVREKAAVEIEDIKDQIRRLGLRIHGLEGVSIEGTYLIGRLGIAYIKKGAGTLIEVAEKIQTSMPELKLSFIDVMKALNTKNPRAERQKRTKTEGKVSKFLTMARIHIELDSLARGVDPEIIRRVPVNEDIRKLQKELAKARAIYWESDINQAKLERAISKLDELQEQLKNGRKKLVVNPKTVPPELKNIHEKIRETTTAINVKEELAKTNEQLRTGIYEEPVKRVRKPVSPELNRNQIQLKKNKRAIRQLIAASAPWSVWKKLGVPFNEARTLMATGELSFVWRQNGIPLLGHPIATIGLKKKAVRIGKTLRGEPIA